MERDIKDYEEKYIKNEFEQYKVIYRRRKIVEIIEQYHVENILEIGCGLEPLFCYINKGGYFVTVEPASQMYENAKKLSEKYKNVVCIKGFFEEEIGNLPDVHYDMVICSSLLHEVNDPLKLLAAIKKVCGRETIVHINVPNMNSLHRLLGVEMNIITDKFEASDNNKKFQQNTNFDLEKLMCMVENSGLKVIENGSYFVKPFSHEQMNTMMQQNIIDEKVLDGLYSITKYMPQFGSEIYVNCKTE